MKNVVIGLAVCLVCCTAVRGAVVFETELGGTTNNTVGTAQGISPGSFTTPVPLTVFNPPGWATASVVGTGGDFTGDVDFYAFSTPGGGALFDMDNPVFFFDTIVSIFDSAGTLIAVSDDSASDVGSASGLDSFIGVLTLSPGSYYVGVSQFANFPSTYFSAASYPSLIRPDSQFGGNGIVGAPVGDSSYGSSGADGTLDYTLHISLENVGGAVPEASSFLAWAIVGVMAVGMLKLRKSLGYQAARASEL